MEPHSNVTASAALEVHDVVSKETDVATSDGRARLFNVTLVTADVRRLAAFWSGALGYAHVEAGDDLVRLAAPTAAGPDLLVLRSAQPASSAGRVHLDLAAADVVGEVQRLVGLGASLADGGTVGSPVWRTGNGISWVVLVDPDGNEMCLGGLPLRESASAPVEDVVLAAATPQDAAELLVLQRCCWVDEAIANDTLEVAALYETLNDLQAWMTRWTTWCARRQRRLVGAVRARRSGRAWEIGRLMVAPDLAGHGLGRWLLGVAEAAAPDDVDAIELCTGARSRRNIRTYELAGYGISPLPAPAGAVRLVKPRHGR
jgi:tRNA (guanine37-N1)-methyltransferase